MLPALLAPLCYSVGAPKGLLLFRGLFSTNSSHGFSGSGGSLKTLEFIVLLKGVVFKLSSRGSRGFQCENEPPLPKQPLPALCYSGGIFGK